MKKPVKTLALGVLGLYGLTRVYFYFWGKKLAGS